MRGVYRLCTRLEYLTEQNCPLKGKQSFYQPRLDEDNLVTVFGDQILISSPSRLLCFDYILHECSSLLGDTKHVLDIGCGYGNYAAHIKSAHGYASYQGYDIETRATWDDLADEKTRFDVATLGVDTINVDKVDTVFSQSVLEHVAFDRAVFDRFSVTTPRVLNHIHFIPATRSFFEHRYHGYRRYGPCTINRLLSSPSIKNIEVIALSNWVGRETHALMRGKAKKVRAFGDRSVVPAYDPSLSSLKNLIARKNFLTASQITDASFFALRFDQHISAP